MNYRYIMATIKVVKLHCCHVRVHFVQSFIIWYSPLKILAAEIMRQKTSTLLDYAFAVTLESLGWHWALAEPVYYAETLEMKFYLWWERPSGESSNPPPIIYTGNYEPRILCLSMGSQIHTTTAFPTISPLYQNKPFFFSDKLWVLPKSGKNKRMLYTLYLIILPAVFAYLHLPYHNQNINNDAILWPC